MIVKFDEHLLIDYLQERVRTCQSVLADGQCCLVAFDFPNAASKARDRWRRFIKRAGFRQEQLSLWATEKDVADDLIAMTQLLGIEKWVRIYVAKQWT